MSLTTQLPGLYIIHSEEKGRAVYCTEDIAKGSTIEICPVIVISPEETALIHRSILHDYYFVWDIESKSSAIALGYGSLYNHSGKPNADFEVDKLSEEIRVTAIEDIPAGTEITLDYISSKEEGIELWFDPK